MDFLPLLQLIALWFTSTMVSENWQTWHKGVTWWARHGCCCWVLFPLTAVRSLAGLPAGFRKRNSMAITASHHEWKHRDIMTGGPGWDKQMKKRERMCQAECHYCTQKWLFRYALALKKASRVFCGECSCQFLVHLEIIQGGSYPEVSVKLCHSYLLFFYRMLKRIVWHVLDISIIQDCCFTAHNHAEIYQQGF